LNDALSGWVISAAIRSQSGEGGLRDGVLTCLHIGKEIVVSLPERWQYLDGTTRLAFATDKPRGLRIDKNIADMRSRDAKTIGDRAELCSRG
jgi:hypothetical protein